jgi:hypothetical protein
VEPLGDGDEKDGSLCLRPVTLRSGRKLPQCLDMISAADVIRAVENYLRFDASVCPGCAGGGEPDDLFCGSCGRALQLA